MWKRKLFANIPLPCNTLAVLRQGVERLAGSQRLSAGTVDNTVPKYHRSGGESLVTVCIVEPGRERNPRPLAPMQSTTELTRNT